MTPEFRIGNGYDIHPLVPGRPLILGGANIPFSSGLEGWSDGDVLIHAVIESLLGAAALGDIGRHFPPGDQHYKDISSVILLEKVIAMLKGDGWSLGNLDVTVIAEEPKLGPYVENIREILAEKIGVPAEKISVKAKSTNGIGPIGSGCSIAALSVSLIVK